MVMKTMLGYVAVGALLGLAWAAALRAWMVLLALELGERPSFTWAGTFAAILLPALLMGAWLGGAAFTAQTSASTGWRWAWLAPLLLVLGPLLFQRNFIPTLLTTGLGGGAIGVALIGMLGGYALSGVGPLWTRWAAGLLPLLLFVAAPFYALYSVNNGPQSVLNIILLTLLLAALVAGVSAPAWLARPRPH